MMKSNSQHSASNIVENTKHTFKIAILMALIISPISILNNAQATTMISFTGTLQSTDNTLTTLIPGSSLTGTITLIEPSVAPTPQVFGNFETTSIVNSITSYTLNFQGSQLALFGAHSVGNRVSLENNLGAGSDFLRVSTSHDLNIAPTFDTGILWNTSLVFQDSTGAAIGPLPQDVSQVDEQSFSFGQLRLLTIRNPGTAGQQLLTTRYNLSDFQIQSNATTINEPNTVSAIFAGMLVLALFLGRRFHSTRT